MYLFRLYSNTQFAHLLLPPRTSEDILKLVDYAKLDSSDLIPYTQTLEFSPSYDQNNGIILVEMDSKMLDLIEQGQR